MATIVEDKTDILDLLVVSKVLSVQIE